MIWVLKVVSLILYIILIVLVIIYLVISSRTRICLVNKVNTPICFNDWKCDGETVSASTQLMDQLKIKPNCTLDAYQQDINKLCAGLTPDSDEFIECISCVVYSRTYIYNCQPDYSSLTGSRNYLKENYDKAISDVETAIGSNYKCGEKKFCNKMQGISFTYNSTTNTCTPKI